MQYNAAPSLSLPGSPEAKHSTLSLRNLVKQALRNYFNQLEDQTPTNLYEIVLTEVELSLLEVIFQQARGNQTKAAKWLGLSRSTLRKKLQHYQLHSIDSD